eukprot:gene16343-22538_t
MVNYKDELSYVYDNNQSYLVGHQILRHKNLMEPDARTISECIPYPAGAKAPKFERYHPDRHMGDENAKREFQRVLRDEQSRHLYDLNLLDQLDVEDYLSRYQGFILTVSGLGMTSQTLEAANDDPSCSDFGVTAAEFWLRFGCAVAEFWLP